MNHELVAKYGKPERLPTREDGCPVWAHSSEESARAFAAANGEFGSAEFADRRWLSVYDIAAASAALRSELGDGTV